MVDGDLVGAGEEASAVVSGATILFALIVLLLSSFCCLL